MKIEDLKTEYATQDNRDTAYPIYVTVQELRFIGVIADGYSPNCPFGDDEIRLEHDCDYCDDYPNRCWNKERDEEEPKHCRNDRKNGYIWHPVEFFLTIKGAEEYMKANAHNHDKLRTYVHSFKRRNYEMRNLLKELGFKSNDLP